jgi:hypothetical protein
MDVLNEGLRENSDVGIGWLQFPTPKQRGYDASAPVVEASAAVASTRMASVPTNRTQDQLFQAALKRFATLRNDGAALAAAVARDTHTDDDAVALKRRRTGSAVATVEMVGNHFVQGEKAFVWKDQDAVDADAVAPVVAKAEDPVQRDVLVTRESMTPEEREAYDTLRRMWKAMAPPPSLNRQDSGAAVESTTSAEERVVPAPYVTTSDEVDLYEMSRDARRAVLDAMKTSSAHVAGLDSDSE